MIIEELQLVFIIKDKSLKNKDVYTQFSKYTRALIKFF